MVIAKNLKVNVFVVVDQRMSVFFSSTHKAKAVVAAEIAALIARRTTGAGNWSRQQVIGMAMMRILEYRAIIE